MMMMMMTVTMKAMTARKSEKDHLCISRPLGPHLPPRTPRKPSNLTDLLREINDNMSEQHFANRKRSLNAFIPGGSPWLEGKWLSNHFSKDAHSGIHPGRYLVIC